MLRRVLRWFAPYWRMSARVVGLVFVFTLLGIVTRTLYPVIFKFIIDHLVAETSGPGDARWWILVLLGLGLLREVNQSVLPACRYWLNVRNALNIRMRHAGTVLRKGHGFFSRFQTGDIITRLTDDIDGHMDKLGWYSGSGVFRPVEAVLTLLFSLSVMFVLHWKLTLAAILPLPLIIWMISKTEKLQHERYLERQKRVSETVDALESAFAGIRIVVGYCMEKAQERIMDETLVRRDDAEKKVVVLQAVLEGIFSLVNQAGLIVVLFFGGWLVLNDPDFTLGDFYAFTAYLSGLTMPLWTISWFFVSTNVADTSIDRMKEIEREPERKPGDADLGKRHPTLELRELGFSHAEHTVLERVSIRVRPGETVALVGPVGCGKTTLLDCALGLLEPGSGRILLGGTPLDELSDEARSRAMAYSPQEPPIFSGTVGENITLGREGVADEEVERTLQTVRLAGELGADAKVTQSGKNLSGGQRGRVSIARSLAGRPDVLVLDDVTSALDARTERHFWDHLRRHLPDAAVLVSTHREATAAHADRVLWLEKGVILHEGTHQELLREPGYQRLFAAGAGDA